MRIEFTADGKDYYAIKRSEDSIIGAVQRSIERRFGDILTWREDCRAMNGSYCIVQAAIANGKTVMGATPFRNIWITIFFRGRL